MAPHLRVASLIAATSKPPSNCSPVDRDLAPGRGVGVTPVTDKLDLQGAVKEESGACYRWPSDRGQGMGPHGGSGPRADPREGRRTADPAGRPEEPEDAMTT